MKKLQDVHTVAERFIREWEKGNNPSFYAPADNPNIVTLADSITERVVVMRNEAPQYFVGFKSSGRPVFTHDLKLANAYDASSLKLVDILKRMKMYEIPVETMPACWFSNYQRE